MFDRPSQTPCRRAGRRATRRLAAIALLAFAPLVASAEDWRVEKLIAGLSHPWAVAFLPDGDALITERDGRLQRWDGEQLHRVRGVPEVVARGQGGLLDVAIHREGETTWVYLSRAARVKRGVATAVSRHPWEQDRLGPAQELFAMNKATLSRHHFGSRLLIEGEYLYITLGDRGDRMRAQDLGDHAGSVVRLHLDGRVPADNPFVGRRDALPGLYSVGHRNVQGIDIGPSGIHSIEHGPQGGDEINRLQPGANYGWPLVSHGAEYGSGEAVSALTSAPDFVDPVQIWVPSIAPGSLLHYNGTAFPEWRGGWFASSLKFGQLWYLPAPDAPAEEHQLIIDGEHGRLRDLAQAPDGSLWLTVDSARGAVLRVAPAD